MNKIVEAITLYSTFFVIAAFIFLFLPFGYCFITWDWHYATIQNVLELLRLDAIVSAILLFLFYINQMEAN